MLETTSNSLSSTNSSYATRRVSPRRVATSHVHVACALALGLAALTATCVARAEPGAVVLRDGRQIDGNVLAVMPNDRVVIALPDGTSTTIAWSEVAWVADGARLYDSAGTMTMREAPAPQPVAPTPPASYATPGQPAAAGQPVYYPSPAYGAPAPMQSDAYARYSALPRRPGSVALVVFGGLMLLSGASSVGQGLVTDCDEWIDDPTFTTRDSCDRYRRRSIGFGALSLGVGGLAFRYGIHRLRVRRAGIRQLRSEGYVVDRSLELGLDASATALVPRLRLRF